MESRESTHDFLLRALKIRCADPAHALQRAVEARLLSRHLPEGMVLDLACGNGTFADGVLNCRGAVGLDISRRATRRARMLPAFAAVLRADAAQMPFRENSLACIFSNSALEHIEAAPEVMAEAARVLQPGGRFLLTVHGEGFGEWTVPSAVFRKLGIRRLGDWYVAWRRRRLAIVNLWPLRRWVHLLEKAGLETVETGTYFPVRVERLFEKLLSLSYIGVPHANLGAAARVLVAALDYAGISTHRRWLAGFWARRLRAGYDAGLGEGSCYFLLARKR